MSKWRKMAHGAWERMLLENIVDTDSICPDYRDIFVDPLTIQKLENVTSLSLRKPKAFGHGVLRSNRITGAILYGPPGTGKSLLCRCLARQSNMNMLVVSAAEMWQKCWGDDEKVIKAIFSLARKLHPCIVFIDEADAMFGVRKGGEQRHIRSMINQFLMEWDGLATDVKAPFILLATNRPFDLDPAVLRRAPVHIHMDLPTTDERLGILKVLLKGEKLGSDIDAGKLAKMTPRFSGSDLKSLCVQAALECVGEQSDDTDVRVVERRHFMSALQSIRATGMTKTTAAQYEKFEKHARNQEAGEEY
ncbi:ATPase family aaa domain-containing protein 1-a [Lasiodiplodia theobromae]|nr:ATPase family aaa domain-containing protein 1-a [Lasiodiplodia theobromae]KAF4534967.1 ATPase family aaa domain-containing protein 1-a [Lasiodiplodia theobromae]